MKIHRLTFAAVELPLVRPLVTSQQTIASRHLLTVALHGEDGVGIGEVATLPEFGTESFDLAFEILSCLVARPELPPLPWELSGTDLWLKELGVSREFAPCTAWSLECGMASLIARRRGVPLLALLGTDLPDQVAVNALIGGGTTSEILWAAEQAVELGYHTIKIKLGTRPVMREVEIVQRLREACSDRIEIRGDANESWSLEQALDFCTRVRDCGLEFIEDPLREPTADTLSKLRRESPVAIALDAFTCRPDGFEQILDGDLCPVVVLKPAAIGSFSLLERMASDARSHGIAVVISNLIESSIGLSYATTCAAAFGSRYCAHGLATAQWLAKDTLSTACEPHNGELAIYDTVSLRDDLISRLKRELDVMQTDES